MHHANWIDGSWGDAAKGDRFETELDGRWPRSGGADVAAALEAARGAAEAWRATDLDARVEVLEDALDRWEEDASAEERLATLLGLSEEALDRPREEAIDLADTLLEEVDDPGAGVAGEPVLVRVPAAELSQGLVRALFPPLLAGATVVVLSDPDLPRLAASFCGRLDEVGLAPGVVSLLHDDRSGALRAALHSGGFSRIRFGGTAAQTTAVEKVLASGVNRSRVVERGPVPFGAGVIEVEPPELRLYTPRNASLVVRAGDDPEDAARRVCRAAFSPEEALSGQKAGQIGRVLCHERLFAEFTDALLVEIDELGGARCAPIDRGLRAYVEGLSRIGLDEGATMIRGEFGSGTPRRAASRRATPMPVVFTNVEVSTEIARASRPAPVLSLLRVGGDREGEEMEKELGG